MTPRGVTVEGDEWGNEWAEPARLLQRGERVLSTARTKGNFAYKGVM